MANKIEQLVRMKTKEIKQLHKPIRKAIYTHELEKKPDKPNREVGVKKALPRDTLKCDICGKTYTRSNRSNHQKTSFHKTYARMNTKLKKIILD